MSKLKCLVVIISFLLYCDVFALESIKINDEYLSPVFEPNTFVYNYYTNDNNIKISVSKSKDEEVSGYGYFEIKDGLNEFNITSNDLKYKINVFKNYNKELDSLCSFKFLNIENYDINFNSNTKEYNIIDFKESKLDFDYELDSLSSSVFIKHNGNFINENNDVILTIVSKDNKCTDNYVFHVNKAVSVFKSNDNKEMSYIKKDIVIIIILTISSILIVYVFYLLFVKKIF